MKDPSMEAILRTIHEIYVHEEEQGATTVYFVCSKCSSPYRATQIRRSKPTSGRMNCLDCGGRVHQWSGIYDFIDWQPERPEGDNGPGRTVV
jgi:DNA-directed RNA polymerase subunit RPC12/RpoP